MEMKITYGKKVIELKSVKAGGWDIETRTSFRTPDIMNKLDNILWKIIKKNGKRI